MSFKDDNPDFGYNVM